MLELLTNPLPYPADASTEQIQEIDTALHAASMIRDDINAEIKRAAKEEREAPERQKRKSKDLHETDKNESENCEKIRRCSCQNASTPKKTDASQLSFHHKRATTESHHASHFEALVHDASQLLSLIHI